MEFHSPNRMSVKHFLFINPSTLYEYIHIQKKIGFNLHLQIVRHTFTCKYIFYKLRR